MFTKVWDDPEIGGRIYMQAMFLYAAELAEENGDRLMGEVLYDVMHKLTAMRFHLEEYRRLEEELYQKYRADFQANPNLNAECFPLIFAFEAFLFQLKSCLDILVKMFGVVKFRQQMSIQTFGNKGEDVIRGLRQNQATYQKLVDRGVSKNGKHWIAHLELLISTVQAAREGWLAEAVDTRDDVSHYKAAKNFVFSPVPTPAGFDASRPTFKRHGATIEPLALMDRLHRECLLFCQDFMCRTLNLIAWPYDLCPVTPEWAAKFTAGGGDQYTQYLKWEWRTKEGGIVTGIGWIPDPPKPEKKRK